MKTTAIKIALALLVFVFCTVIGVNEIATSRVGTGIFTLFLGISNIPLAWLHWYTYKRQKELEA